MFLENKNLRLFNACKSLYIAAEWKTHSSHQSGRETCRKSEKGISYRCESTIHKLCGKQYILLEAMEYNDTTPSLAQAIKMKRFSKEGNLSVELK